MSLRDFNSPASDDPIALHNEPLGNGAGLSDFHTVNVEESERSNTPKIVGAVAVALMVGAAALGLYAYSGPSTKPVVADNSLPKTAPVTPPPQQTAMAPDSSMNGPAPSTAPATPAPEPAATKSEPAKPAPVHTASRSSHHIRSASASEPAPSDAASVRMSADTSRATQAPQQAQVTPQPAQQATPLPAAPTPSPSDVASNGGQSSAAVPNNATTASDIPQPQAAPAPAQPQAPAQTTQPEATPAPAPAQ